MTYTKKLKPYLSVLALGFLGCFIISCSDADFVSDSDSELSEETVQNYIDQSVYSIQAESNIGRMGCFEFIFPVTIEYPDGTTSTAEDYDNLRTQLQEWAENNAEVFENDDEVDEDGDEEGRGRTKYGYKGDIDWDLLPSLSFPLEVVAEDGTLSTISDQTELFELKRTCRKDFYGNKGRHGHNKGDRCFSLVFPLTLVLPDATTITGTDRQDLKTQIREWKSNNPDATEKPALQYPVTIELEDGTTQEIASVEDFTALKESCSDTE